jgi:hypothetical protein
MGELALLSVPNVYERIFSTVEAAGKSYDEYWRIVIDHLKVAKWR